MHTKYKYDDYFSEEDAPEPEPEKKPKAKKPGKDVSSLMASVFPESQEIRERVLGQLTSEHPITRQLGEELLMKPKELPFQLISGMTFDIYQLLDIDPADVKVSQSQALMVLVWAYIKEYERMKKEDAKHEK